MAKFIQYQTKASLYDGPFDSVVGWSAAGTGDLIVTDHGRLIVIDGGRREDAESFLELLEANSDGRPVVDLWIITHPHNDHYGALCALCHTPELLASVEIRNLVYDFPNEFETRAGAKPNPEHNRRLGECLQLSGAEYFKPQIGDRFDIDGITVEFLYTPYDCRILNGVGNENYCSMILSVAGPKEKVMVTGDANGRNMQVCAWLHRKQLHCGVLQMPHHGLCDAYNLDFYREVSPRIVLIPTSIAGSRAMHNGQYSGAGIEANLWCEENAERVIRSCDGTAGIEI